jgi:hypothetical protein
MDPNSATLSQVTKHSILNLSRPYSFLENRDPRSFCTDDTIAHWEPSENVLNACMSKSINKWSKCAQNVFTKAVKYCQLAIWVWWYMPVISALRKLRRAGCVVREGVGAEERNDPSVVCTYE